MAGRTRVLDRFGIDFPTIRFTVPDGWASGVGSRTGSPEGEDAAVYMMFWDVGRLYRPSVQVARDAVRSRAQVDDLASAIVDIPLRNASQPIDVTLDGYAGKYVEWSVPTDIETDEQGTSSIATRTAATLFRELDGDRSGWAAIATTRVPARSTGCGSSMSMASAS